MSSIMNRLGSLRIKSKGKEKEANEENSGKGQPQKQGKEKALSLAIIRGLLERKKGKSKSKSKSKSQSTSTSDAAKREEDAEIPDELKERIDDVKGTSPEANESEEEDENDDEDEEARKKRKSEAARKSGSRNLTSLNAQQVLDKEEAKVIRLTETFSIPRDLAWEVCDRFGWKMEKIFEFLLEKAAELDTEPETSTATSSSVSSLSQISGMDCSICGDEISLEKSLKLTLCPEEHRFCTSCWASHAMIQIKEGAIPISCMANKCANHLVDPEVISSLVDKESLELFRYKTATNFMAKSKRMRWCPSPNCQKAVEFKDDAVECDVRCECGTPFCFTCGNEWHSPIDCKTYRKWCDKCSSEGESAKWISAFTRACPNPQCLKPIEKNGGCPHMHCKACNQHFCWTCMQLYVNGSHVGCKGQLVVPASQLEVTKSLDRYRSGYMGFDACISKEKEIKNLTQLAKQKTKEYRDCYSEHWNKVTPFEDAVKVYADALRILRFTFVLCYFAEEQDTKESPFLNFLKDDLVASINQLEKLVSSKLWTHEHKDEIKRVANAVKAKSQSIISTTREGVTQNSDLYRLVL